MIKLGHSKTIMIIAIMAMFVFSGLPSSGGGFAEPSVEWIKTYGPLNGYPTDYRVIQTSDGGYAIIGCTASYNIYGSANYSRILIKTDSSGEMQWINNYFYNYPILVQPDDLVCLLWDAGGRFIKVDVDMQVLWNKTYGSLINSISVWGIQTSDGGFLLSGSVGDTYYGFSDKGYSAVLVRLDSGGCELWKKTFSAESAKSYGFVRGAMELGDGGFTLVGTWAGAFWFVRLDSLGNLLWDYHYKVSEPPCSLVDCAPTVDGGYVIAGFDGSDSWLIKTGSLGKEQWRVVCKGEENRFRSIKQTSDGGFIVAGEYRRLIKFDALGTIEWNISIDMDPRDIVVADDGGYVLIGNVMDTFRLVKVVSVSGSPDASNTPNNNTMLTLSPALAAVLIVVIVAISAMVIIIYFKKHKHRQ